MTSLATAPETILGATVFTDIAGFTEFTALQGDAEAFRLLSLQESLVTQRLPAGARVVKELGDGLLLWFPDARSAVVSALDLQERFAEASDESGLPLWVRMGVHWGTQMRRGNDIVGHDVNLASRIVNVAAPGEVLVSEATVEAAGGLEDMCQVDELGPMVMKGIPEPVRLYRVERDSV